MMQTHAQTGRIFRFTLRKEWLKLLLWLIGGAFYVIMGVVAFVEVYGDPLERQAMAMAMQNPAMEALFGRAIGIDNYTIGAMYSHTMTILGFALFAIMSILLVVRNTRSEEEDGILELIQALPTGRLAHTTSAIILLLVTNVLVALISAGLLIGLGDASMSTEGALLTGVIYGMTGLLFGAITLVTAQLSSNARGAMMLAFGALGLSYVFRIIGDSGMEVFSWISPLGLLYNTEPFVNNYWFPVWIALGISLVLIVLALFLKHQRDMGAGLLPDRSGRRHASAFLKTPIGFVVKLVKTPLIVWAVAMVFLGISYGSVIGDVEGLLEGNEVIEQIIAGDPDISMVDQFMAMILGVLAMAATIPSLQVMLRLRGEEKKNRLEKVIAGAHSRLIIFGSFIVLSAIVAIALQILQSLAFGGAAVAMGYDVSLVEIIVAGFAYIPAMYVMIGVAALLIGWLPKLTSLVWLYLGFAFMILYFGGLFDFPEIINGLSPFYHVPQMPIDDWNWIVTLALTGISLVLSVVGYLGYSRRDID
ncbi:MAG: hypothetical protein JJU16_09460 [Alkalibacterium sp.]|nr:hypothetical protein [Alkalibacterium sp.]